MAAPVIIESVEVAVAVLNKCSDGVFEVRMSQGSRVEVADMEELLRAQFNMTPTMAGVLVDARGVASMTRAAQELTANNPVNHRTAATAILVASPVSALLGNFFIRFARPPYPARLFRKEDEARKWVLEHLAKRTSA